LGGIGQCWQSSPSPCPWESSTHSAPCWPDAALALRIPTWLPPPNKPNRKAQMEWLPPPNRRTGAAGIGAPCSSRILFIACRVFIACRLFGCSWRRAGCDWYWKWRYGLPPLPEEGETGEWGRHRLYPKAGRGRRWGMSSKKTSSKKTSSILRDSLTESLRETGSRANNRGGRRRGANENHCALGPAAPGTRPGCGLADVHSPTARSGLGTRF